MEDHPAGTSSDLDPDARVAGPASAARTRRWWPVVFSIIVGAVAALVFAPQVHPKITPEYWDLPMHLRFVAEGAAGLGWPVHPLFHLLVWLLDVATPLGLGATAVLVLCAAIAARTFITYIYLDERMTSYAVVTLTALALVLAMPFPNWWRPSWTYMGQISGAIWHSPTTVLVMPLSLLLFVVCVRFLDKPKVPTAAVISLLMVANAVTKPNYVMILLPVILVASVVASTRDGRFVRIAFITIAAAPVLLVLLWQWRDAYSGAEAARVVWAPFQVWSYYSPNIFASVALSAVFPLSFVILFGRRAFEDRPVVLAWATFAVGVLAAAFLSETGVRAQHANWFWGAHIAIAVLFMATAGRLGEDFDRGDWRSWIVLGALGIHAAVGVWYFVRIAGGGLYA